MAGGRMSYASVMVYVEADATPHGSSLISTSFAALITIPSATPAVELQEPRSADLIVIGQMQRIISEEWCHESPRCHDFACYYRRPRVRSEGGCEYAGGKWHQCGSGCCHRW